MATIRIPRSTGDFAIHFDRFTSNETVKKKHTCLSAIAISILLSSAALDSLFGRDVARAADHLNLEEGLPVEVEDAYPIPYKGIEFQAGVRYERTGDGEDTFLVEPRLEWGFAPNWQGRISVPFAFGDNQENDLEDVGLEIFYNFNAESLRTPAFAIAVNADFPTGSDSSGVDPSFRFITTKTIGSEKLERLHLNVALNVNTEREADERGIGVETVLGYSRRLNPETILVGDFAFEQEERENEKAFLLELGVRHQISPLSVLSVGAGTGLTGESPDFRLTFGFQRSF